MIGVSKRRGLIFLKKTQNKQTGEKLPHPRRSQRTVALTIGAAGGCNCVENIFRILYKIGHMVLSGWFLIVRMTLYFQLFLVV